MAKLKVLRSLFDHAVNSLRCSIYGHLTVKILETYEPTYREKRLRSSAEKNYRTAVLQTDKIYIEKCACLSCGAVFLRRCIEPVWPRQ